MLAGVATVVLFGTAALPCAAAVFHVRDYGAEPNRETDSGEALRAAALCIVAARPGQALAEAGVETIHDVRIEDNEFQDQAGHALFVSGAQGVSVVRNRIRAGAEAESRRNGPVFLIENSSAVTLQDNTVADPRRGTTAAVEIGPTVGPEGVAVSGLKAQLHPRAEKILDRRMQP